MSRRLKGAVTCRNRARPLNTGFANDRSKRLSQGRVAPRGHPARLPNAPSLRPGPHHDQPCDVARWQPSRRRYLRDARRLVFRHVRDGASVTDGRFGKTALRLLKRRRRPPADRSWRASPSAPDGQPAAPRHDRSEPLFVIPPLFLEGMQIFQPPGHHGRF